MADLKISQLPVHSVPTATDLLPIVNAGTTKYITYANLTPFAASSHTHTIANITGLQAELDGKALASHTHTIANITNLQTELDGKAAVLHTHGIGAITGLQAELDALQADIDTRAIILHTHAIQDVTNLQTELDALAADIAAGDTTKVLKAGDTMTGALTISAGGLTVSTAGASITGSLVNVGQTTSYGYRTSLSLGTDANSLFQTTGTTASNTMVMGSNSTGSTGWPGEFGQGVWFRGATQARDFGFWKSNSATDPNLYYMFSNGTVWLDAIIWNSENTQKTASGNRWDVIPVISSSGVMEAGRYIDFHISDTDTADYSWRLDAQSAELFWYNPNTSAHWNIYDDSSNYARIGYNPTGVYLTLANTGYTTTIIRGYGNSEFYGGNIIAHNNRVVADLGFEVGLWRIDQSGTTLRFLHNGSIRATLTSGGTLSVEGDGKFYQAL